MLEDAIVTIAANNAYSPIIEKIESVEWDGIPRIETLLTKVMGAEDSEYTRNVSEILFSGIINRIYNPGCKYDYVVTLISKEQGKFKSTFVSLLGLGFGNEIKYIKNDKDTMESLLGSTVVELPELVVNQKNEDFLKAFVSSTSDRFRKAYGHHAQTYKRTCVFVGTTNREKFVHDTSGGRRFLPVVVNPDVVYNWSHIEEIKNDILQCYAEAKFKLIDGNGTLATCEKPELHKEFVKHQNSIRSDYCEAELIANYLNKYSGNKVCALQVYVEALGHSKEDFDPTISRLINKQIENIDGWEKTKSSTNFGEYGKNRGWRRIKN